ncbi:MAG: hypothetical protein E7645_09265 [Ruminococcaceae bacterium]|nr:hypothetical protein [Oscillospiraceae bacterium]
MSVVFFIIFSFLWVVNIPVQYITKYWESQGGKINCCL